MTTFVNYPGMQPQPIIGVNNPFSPTRQEGIFQNISGGPVSDVGTVDQYGGLNLGTATAGTSSTGLTPEQIRGQFTSNDLTLLPPEGVAAQQQTQNQGLLGGLLGGVSDFLGLGDTGVQQALGGLGGAYLAERAYSRLGDIGETARREASEIARQGLTQAEFRPFTVTTATGGMMGVGPEGGTTMAVSPEEQALQQQLMGGAGQFFGQAQMPTTAREQAVFERIRAAQRPEEERQRLALEERLAAQGRLGTSSAAYGGATPEQLAMATAREEARNRAMLTAMQQAQAEQAQQAALGQQFLGAGYVPQQQLIAATQPGLTTAQLAQRGQLTGAGLFGEAEMSGLEALLSSGIGQANLFGQIGTGLLSQALRPAPQQLSLEDQLKALVAQQGAGAVSGLMTDFFSNLGGD